MALVLLCVATVGWAEAQKSYLFRLGLGFPLDIVFPTSGASCHFPFLFDCLSLVTLISMFCKHLSLWYFFQLRFLVTNFMSFLGCIWCGLLQLSIILHPRQCFSGAWEHTRNSKLSILMKEFRGLRE